MIVSCGNPSRSDRCHNRVLPVEGLLNHGSFQLRVGEGFFFVATVPLEMIPSSGFVATVPLDIPSQCSAFRDEPNEDGDEDKPKEDFDEDEGLHADLTTGAGEHDPTTGAGEHEEGDNVAPGTIGTWRKDFGAAPTSVVV